LGINEVAGNEETPHTKGMAKRPEAHGMVEAIQAVTKAL
jgi:hypothetical protein